MSYVPDRELRELGESLRLYSPWEWRSAYQESIRMIATRAAHRKPRVGRYWRKRCARLKVAVAVIALMGIPIDQRDWELDSGCPF